jgi:selenocysteine-specific elongation factor
MMTIVGRIFPIQPIAFGKELKWLRLDPDKEIKEFRAIIWLETPEFVEKEDRLLITRLDLPPTSLRIMGTARIQQILSEPMEVHRLRIKQGQVKNPNYTATSVIVEGLSDSVDGARTLIGESADLPFGKILGTFGTKGNVEIEIELSQQANIRKEQPVTLKLTKKITMEYSKTY